jgi:hypothetical protein
LLKLIKLNTILLLNISLLPKILGRIEDGTSDPYFFRNKGKVN